MNSYILARIDADEFDDFVSAWESAFDRKLDSVVYSWIFDKNNIVYVLKCDDEIVAGYCFYQVQCSWNRKLSTALLCNNVFVCPRHQGNSLFVKIGKAALADANARKLGSVAYGIPNELALPGHKRVGWGVQLPLKFLEKEVSCKTSEMTNHWLCGGLDDDLRKKMADCSRMCALERDFSVIKTESFIKWRYESKPGVKYWFGLSMKESEVKAYCVCKYFKEKRTLHVIDIDGKDRNSITSLLNDIESVPEDFIRINVWSSTPRKDIFQSFGYEFSEESNSLIVMDLENIQAVYLNDNINICLGDNDVY